MRFVIRVALGLLGAAVMACAKKLPPELVAVPAATKAATSPLAQVKGGAVAAPDSAAKFKALYFPSNNVYGALPDGFQEIEINSADGLQLNAWYAAPPEGGFLILYFHGNGGNLTSLGPQFEAFLAAGAGALAVDYRGYGKSQGTPSEAGLYLDSEAAYDKALTLGYPPERLVIYGRSLGGGVATYLASKKPAAGLVLESTFTSVQDVARRTHGAWAAALVSGFGSLDRMPKLDIPTFVIHGSADTMIPSDMGETLRAASPQAELWMVKGANHNTVRKVAGSHFVDRLSTFLNQLPKS